MTVKSDSRFGERMECCCLEEQRGRMEIYGVIVLDGQTAQGVESLSNLRETMKGSLPGISLHNIYS